MAGKKTYTVRELSELVPKLEDRIDLLENVIIELLQPGEIPTNIRKKLEIAVGINNGADAGSLASTWNISIPRVSQIKREVNLKFKYSKMRTTRKKLR